RPHTEASATRPKSNTSTVPPGPGQRWRKNSITRRLLPTPAGPVTVTSLASGAASTAASRSRSWVRPMSAVGVVPIYPAGLIIRPENRSARSGVSSCSLVAAAAAPVMTLGLLLGEDQCGRRRRRLERDFFETGLGEPGLVVGPPPGASMPALEQHLR